MELMNKTDKVHIKGQGTDLTFSIKGLDGIKCDGELNIPDGEVFTAPVKDSVNGSYLITRLLFIRASHMKILCWSLKMVKL